MAELEVAHITDAVAFVRAAGHHRGVTFSYRWDNLVTLCGDCHRASHAHHLRQEILERRANVGVLMQELRRLRGWSSPFAALPPALVPPALRPLRSFHDVMRISPLLPFATYAKYASDGGLVFGDGEARPLQSRLEPDVRLEPEVRLEREVRLEPDVLLARGRKARLASPRDDPSGGTPATIGGGLAAASAD